MKSYIKYLVLVLLAGIIFGIVYFGILKYKNWTNLRILKTQAEKFEQNRKNTLEKINTDTYGGATPQKTLQMFIDAVTAGDYTLASKYFVVEKQKAELKDLQEAPLKNIQNVTMFLKKAKNTNGSYLGENKYFIDGPILVEFIKYPSNLWKINEI